MNLFAIYLILCKLSLSFCERTQASYLGASNSHACILPKLVQRVMANTTLSSRFEHHNQRQWHTDYTLSKQKHKKAGYCKQMKSTNTDKNFGRVTKAKHLSPFKQPFVYETLLATAIKRSPMQALTVAEIHAYVADIYPYFKTCPGRLKANIVQTLSTSTCFEKLGSPCEHYWTLTSKAKTLGRIAEDKKDRVAWPEHSTSTVFAKNYAPCCQPADDTRSTLFVGKTESCAGTTEKAKGIPLGTKRSYEQNAHILRAYSQASSYRLPVFSQLSPMYTPFVSHWQPAVSTIPTFSQPTSSGTFSTAANHEIPDSPFYPRVPVITPGRQNQRELGIRIGEVFSLNPQSSSVLSKEMLSCSQVKELSGTEVCFIPYHPCTFRTSYPSPNSPTLSSFVSEDKERYEDA